MHGYGVFPFARFDIERRGLGGPDGGGCQKCESKSTFQDVSPIDRLIERPDTFLIILQKIDVEYR
jgi:hypothetical protein